MEAIYHLKIKKEYATSLIEDLIKSDAVESIQAENEGLPQWQRDALDDELAKISANPNYGVKWESVKNNFKQA
ncbi:addiction module protein [Parasediminibacterium sp. JCM 36343]|uniref:addiction module protein n=1 Tax=Parasediminibacterium sp. JCM 36343 TaxID=3374279 RepID=UPI00397AF226